MNNKLPIIAIVGPTASGKSALALYLAEQLNGEIISCDSMQVYRGMDIGTAKPTKEEQQRVRHHMIDIIDPADDFSCADYKPLAEKAVSAIAASGKTPIFCGGTGLYLRSVLSVSGFSPNIPDGIREELNARSSDELFEELLLVDPCSAASTHKNNRKRVIRALEIYRGTGRPKSEWDRLSRGEVPYCPLCIGLDYRNRENLYTRIDARIDKMMDEGLWDEVMALNIPRQKNAAQAIGYKELYRCIDGEIGKEDAVDQLRLNTRHYAKRQLTWFRKDPTVHWFYPDEIPAERLFDEVLAEALRHLAKKDNPVG